MNALSTSRVFHIYALSRVFRKNPTAWLNLINELERDRSLMRSIYAPLRTAINFEIKRPGSGRDILERRLKKLESMPNSESIKLTSRLAFTAFRDEILPLIECIEEDYVNRPGGNLTFQFEGYFLEGAFHARVRLKTGGVRYIYLHPSQWDENQTLAFRELLVIMGERAYGMGREELWFLDLRAGLSLAAPKTYKSLRKELTQTLRLMDRVAS